MNTREGDIISQNPCTSGIIATQNFRALLSQQQAMSNKQSYQDAGSQHSSENEAEEMNFEYQPFSPPEAWNMSVDSVINADTSIETPTTYVFVEPTTNTNSIGSGEAFNNHQVVDQDLYDTLKDINCENADYLYPLCVKHNIKHTQLQYLKDFHMEILVPKSQLGIMAEFQHKLDVWKSLQFEKADDIDLNLSCRNKEKSLIEIISSNNILMSKVQKSKLTDKESKALITIVKDFFMNQCRNQMRLIDMERISKEIANYFPGEDSETYFKRSLVKKGDGTFKTKCTGRLVSKWTNRSD